MAAFSDVSMRIADIPSTTPRCQAADKGTRCGRKLEPPDVALACKCKSVFCKYHRQPHQHSCTFDYRAHHMKVLLPAADQARKDKPDTH
jgi:hypothetical protein